MELWDVYDKDRSRTGRTMERGSVISDGDYHLVIHVCIFNSKGEMLIQKRQPWKKGWPNLWDITVGGSALAGEDSQAAAEREVFEEIGLRIDLANQRPHLTINFSAGFDDYYLIKHDINVDELSLQYEEVAAVKWASKEEVLRLIDKDEFIPYYRSLIELFFEKGTIYGAIRSKI